MIYFTNSHIISRSPVATAIRYGALHPMPRPDIGTARIMPMPIGPFYLGPYIQQLPIVLLLALMIIIISLDGIPKREVRNLDRPTAKQKEKKRVSRTGRSFLSDCSNVGATCRLFWQGHRSQPTGLSLSLIFSFRLITQRPGDAARKPFFLLWWLALFFASFLLNFFYLFIWVLVVRTTGETRLDLASVLSTFHCGVVMLFLFRFDLICFFFKNIYIRPQISFSHHHEKATAKIGVLSSRQKRDQPVDKNYIRVWPWNCVSVAAQVWRHLRRRFKVLQSETKRYTINQLKDFCRSIVYIVDHH